MVAASSSTSMRFPCILSLINAALLSGDFVGFCGSFSLQQPDQFSGVTSTRQEHARLKRSTDSAQVLCFRVLLVVLQLILCRRNSREDIFWSLPSSPDWDCGQDQKSAM